MKKYYSTFFFVVAAFLTLVNNTVSLWDQDEAAYAGFARTMLRSGHWLIPHFTWSLAHRKPPLHFWIIALCFELFGNSEFVLRLSSAIAIWLTYLIVFYGGKKIFGRNESLLAAMILATSLLVPIYAKVAVVDASLLLLSTVCAFCLICLLERPKAEQVIAFWVSLALGMLLKGPPILLFSGMMALLLFIFHPQRRNLWRLRPWFFFPLSLLPLFGWGWLAWQKNPAFIHWLIDWYILRRIHGSVFGQTGPPGMQLLLIIVAFLPWLFVLPRALKITLLGIFQHNKKTLYLSAWFIGGWLIYEFSPSKLPSYVLPAHVPLAIAAAIVLYSFYQGKIRLRKVLFVIQAIINAALGAVLIIFPFYFQMDVGAKASFVSLGIIFAIGSAYILYYRQQLVKRLVGLNLFFQLIVWAVLLPEIDRLKDGSQRASQYFDKNLPYMAVIYIGNNEGHPPSLPFYLSQNHPIKEAYNNDSLLYDYRHSAAAGFVLTQDQSDFFQKALQRPPQKIIIQQLTDRSAKAAYYLWINHEPIPKSRK